MTRIVITLEGTYPEYGETLRKSSEDTESLKDLLTEFGFERSDLKTLSFNVDTEYESYKERDPSTAFSAGKPAGRKRNRKSFHCLPPWRGETGK